MSARLQSNQLQEIIDLTKSSISPALYSQILSCPATSCEVERSFSILNKLLADDRNFDSTNIEMYVMQKFNASVFFQSFFVGLSQITKLYLHSIYNIDFFNFRIGLACFFFKFRFTYFQIIHEKCVDYQNVQFVFLIKIELVSTFIFYLQSSCIFQIRIYFANYKLQIIENDGEVKRADSLKRRRVKNGDKLKTVMN